MAVLLATRWIIAKLRNRQFFSLAELNAAIRDCIADLNARTSRHLGASRRALFEQLDCPALKALPAEPFEFAEWKECRVGLDYHVEVGKHYYSVPFTLLREKLWALDGMADAFAELQQQDAARDLGHAEWLALLLDREAASRNTKRMQSRLKPAHLRHGQASVEDVDYRTPRKLDKALFQQLATGRWIAEHRSLLVTGPCGVGKSWLSCALAQKACRDGYTVHYVRVPRLFADLELAHGDGRFAKLFRTLTKADLLLLAGGSAL